MSLTTRCPSCGTAFRVQPMQLSARGGKVRCGRCASVFDGVAALVEEGAATAGAAPLPDPEPSPQLALFESARKLPALGAAGEAANEEPAIPEFLEEPARPRRKLLWGAASLLALVALAAQATFHYRTAIAGFYPEARPHLEAACARLGCRVPLPRDVRQLRLESSELRHHESRSGVVQLDATFRNSAATRQEYPSLILTLTNAHDEVLARRAIRPEEYLRARGAEALREGISPNTVVAITLYFDNTGLDAIGYRLALQYL
jgi:predicted Zn finger-like uncharacterized protein